MSWGRRRLGRVIGVLDGSAQMIAARRLRLVLTGLLSVLSLLTAHSAALAQETTIERDGAFNVGGSGFITTVEDITTVAQGNGTLTGGTLLHIFSQFDVAERDTAVFTANQRVRVDSVVSRVTSTDPSRIYGTIESRIPGATFYFLNPAGTFFGPNSSIDVPGAFHLSADPSGVFGNGMQLRLVNPGSDLTEPVLTMASSADFGFGDTSFGDITLDGATLLFNQIGLPESENPSISFRSRNLRLQDGAKILAFDGRIKAQATGEISLSGVNDQGDGFGAGIDVATFAGSDPEVSLPGPAIDLEANDINLGANAYLLTESVGIECDGCSAGQIKLYAQNTIALAPRSASEYTPSILGARFPGVDFPGQAELAGAARVVTYRTTDSGSAGQIELSAQVLSGGEQVASFERSQEGIVSGPSPVIEQRLGEQGLDPITILPPPNPLPPPSIGLGLGTPNLGGAPPPVASPPPAGSGPSQGSEPSASGADVVDPAPGVASLDLEQADGDARPTPPRSGGRARGDGGTSSSGGRDVASGPSGGATGDETSSGGEGGTADNTDTTEGDTTDTAEADDGEQTTESESSGGAGSEDDQQDGEGMAPFMGVASRFSDAMEMCGERSEGGETDIMTTYRWPGLPLSPEGPLLAFSVLDADFGEMSSDSEDARKVRSLLESAASALRARQIQRAERRFEEAERVASAAGAIAIQLDAMLGRAEAQQADGRYRESALLLERALKIARDSGETSRESALLGALGNTRVATGDSEAAEALLSEATGTLRGMSIQGPATAPRPEVLPAETRFEIPEGLSSALLNNLGNQRLVAGEPEEAVLAYQESDRVASDAEDWLQAARVRANAASAAFGADAPDEALDFLTSAKRALDRAKATPAEETGIRIHLAQTASLIAKSRTPERTRTMLSAHEDLLAAIEIARAREDYRSASHGLGSLGALYADDYGRTRESYFLTRQAILIAEQAEAPDLRARWQAQLGDLYERDGELSAAVGEYRDAVSLLEMTRPEASPVYGSAEVAFQTAVAPIYRKLTALLLAEAETGAKGDFRQANYREARQVIEQWKTAEVRSYFDDGCAAEARRVELDALDPYAAVVYPVPMDDHLELLVSRSKGIERFTVPVGEAELDAVLSRFLAEIRNRAAGRYEATARQLHDWLVGPYRQTLDQWGTETLVFVPTGRLRTIPMAALRDDEGFLVEDFAVATTVSLNLLNPRSIEPGEAKVLLAGVSEAVQGFSELPSVPAELAAIREIFGGETLLNEEFSAGNFRQAAVEKGREIIHIASHAEFNGDPKTSFVLTYNDRLSTENLSSLIQQVQSEGTELELLVLSACQTAAGNERAALGLAGAAIRSGARSAMGSLWSVSDDATSELLVNFYRSLKSGEANKAEALRSAQLQLISSAEYTHPFYWAPFLILNNWL